MKLSDLQLDTRIVTIGQLVINDSSGRRQEFNDVTAAFAAGFIYVERFLNGQVIVNVHPASAVHLAEDVQAVSQLKW